MTRPGQHPSLATTGRAGVRPPHDLYVTLHDCISPLLDRLRAGGHCGAAPGSGSGAGPDRTVWDPAAGDGRIVRMAAAFGFAGIAQDLHDHSADLPPAAPIETGVDFLQTTEKRSDLLITNPPYDSARLGLEPTLAEKFVRHAIALDVAVSIWFLPLTFLGAINRFDLLSAGGSLRRVDVLVPRPTLHPIDYVPENSGAVVYAWFTFSAVRGLGPGVVDLMKREGY